MKINKHILCEHCGEKIRHAGELKWVHCSGSERCLASTRASPKTVRIGTRFRVQEDECGPKKKRTLKHKYRDSIVLMKLDSNKYALMDTDTGEVLKGTAPMTVDPPYYIQDGLMVNILNMMCGSLTLKEEGKYYYYEGDEPWQ